MVVAVRNHIGSKLDPRPFFALKIEVEKDSRVSKPFFLVLSRDKGEISVFIPANDN